MGINLLPKTQRRIMLNMLFILCLLVVLTSSGYFSYSYYQTLKSDIAGLNEQLSKTEAELARFESVLKMQSELQKKKEDLSRLEDILSPALAKVKISRRVSDIRLKVPDTITIRQLKVGSPGSIRLQGAAPTISSISRLIQNLRELDFLSDPSLEYLRKIESDFYLFELEYRSANGGDES